MIALGHALNVNYKSIAVYSEATIRSNIIYHLSNLLERADCYICNRLKLPPYVVISAGSAFGIVHSVKSCSQLAQLDPKDRSRPVIAFVEDVQGDEEFPEYVPTVTLP